MPQCRCVSDGRPYKIFQVFSLCVTIILVVFLIRFLPEGRVCCFSGVGQAASAGVSPAHGLIICAKFFIPCDSKGLRRVSALVR